jgi:hypothetical protein
MKRVAVAIAALAGLASTSTPAFARTSLADLRGRGEGIERLLEQMHWTLIEPGQDILLEPTVGGKSGVEARVSCRKALQVPS